MTALQHSAVLLSQDVQKRFELGLDLERKLGIKVQTTATARDALALFDCSQPPDILFIDGGLSGEASLAEAVHLITQIKNNNRLRYTPIIALTPANDHKLPIYWLEQGADDFIDQSAPIPIFTARLKTQMRQKLAIDHLERTALDRDLFAAGVLQEVSSIRWSISSLCYQAKSKIEQKALQVGTDIEPELKQLAELGSKIGKYAKVSIDHGRLTEHPGSAEPQDIRQLLEWLTDLLTRSDDSSSFRLAWELPPNLNPILADSNYLKIALFNLAQHLLDQEYKRLRVIRISQEPGETNKLGQNCIRTLFYDAAVSLPASDLPRLFRPYAALASEGGFNLNLSLASKLLAKLGGSVFARLGPHGQGVVYALELPTA